MAKYLVTYDLVGTDETSEDYKNLIAAIKGYPAYLKVQYSAWLIRTSKSAEGVFRELERHLDNNDRLLILQTDGTSWWGRGAIEGDTDDLAAFIRG